jgi:2,4-diaminopentanoate dehydrogenase
MSGQSGAYSPVVDTLSLTPAERRAPVRAGIFGTGKIGRCIVSACRDSVDVDVVAAATTSPDKVGKDLAEVAGTAPLGVTIDSSLDSLLERTDVDVVFYCGLGEPAHVADYLARIVDAGKDAVTLTGLIHPKTALGEAAAEKLERRAIDGGGRIVGAGWNPGFILDVLPVAVAESCVRIDLVSAQRIAEMRDWGRGVHEECGLGRPPDAAKDSPNNPLHESVALIGDALSLGLDRIENSYEPYLSKRDRHHGGMDVAAGTIAGFHKRSLGLAKGQVRVEIEMYGVFCIDPDEDGLSEGATVRVAGDATVAASVSGDWFGDSYPVTAFRAVRSVRPLRTLPPGLYRPDQLPLSG